MKNFKLQKIKHPRNTKGEFINKYTVLDQIADCFGKLFVGTFITGFIIFGSMIYFNQPDKPIVNDKKLIVNKIVNKVNAQSNGTIREVTMYNAGDPNQTDSSPCISANGENICNAIALGYKRCAANFVPIGTDLIIQHYGECKVTDRMNSRYKNRVDIAVSVDEYQRALNFGLQNLLVTIK